ncbi:MAG: hypothetical protein IPG74_11030 [Flavobacteriales bacterium]|nr:hypothetical protein [Flavobacteriales bacterium]
MSELESKLLGQSIVVPGHWRPHPGRNIYGVDINEESVEIGASACGCAPRPGRKPNDLSGNIKCGNSLMRRPSRGGCQGFRLEEEFPAVFAKGGFDVVVGNPPYRL